MLATTLSALYGKLLVVMGIAFPMAEVISTYIPPSFYEVSGVCSFSLYIQDVQPRFIAIAACTPITIIIRSHIELMEK